MCLSYIVNLKNWCGQKTTHTYHNLRNNINQKLLLFQENIQDKINIKCDQKYKVHSNYMQMALKLSLYNFGPITHIGNYTITIGSYRFSLVTSSTDVADLGRGYQVWACPGVGGTRWPSWRPGAGLWCCSQGNLVWRCRVRMLQKITGMAISCHCSFFTPDSSWPMAAASTLVARGLVTSKLNI